MRRKDSRCYLVAVAIGGLLACAHRQAPTPRNAIPPLPVPASNGRTSFTFVADPSVSPPKVSEHQELVAPYPLGKLVDPIYPENALAAGAAPATVFLRIVIGDDGFVSNVSDSPLGASSPSPSSPALRRCECEPWSTRRCVVDRGRGSCHGS